MNTARFASEDHANTEFAGHQSGHDEPPGFDPDDGSDCVTSEGLCERPTDRCEQLRVPQGYREVGVAIRPPE
jgi:hypothetical protein